MALLRERLEGVSQSTFYLEEERSTTPKPPASAPWIKLPKFSKSAGNTPPHTPPLSRSNARKLGSISGIPLTPPPSRDAPRKGSVPALPISPPPMHSSMVPKRSHSEKVRASGDYSLPVKAPRNLSKPTLPPRNTQPNPLLGVRPKSHQPPILAKKPSLVSMTDQSPFINKPSRELPQPPSSVISSRSTSTVPTRELPAPPSSDTPHNPPVTLPAIRQSSQTSDHYLQYVPLTPTDMYLPYNPAQTTDNLRLQLQDRPPSATYNTAQTSNIEDTSRPPLPAPRTALSLSPRPPSRPPSRPQSAIDMYLGYDPSPTNQYLPYNPSTTSHNNVPLPPIPASNRGLIAYPSDPINYLNTPCITSTPG